MLLISLIIQFVMIATLAKLNVTYPQEQKNMLAVTEEVPFTTILINNCCYYGYTQNLFHFSNDSFDEKLFNIN